MIISSDLINLFDELIQLFTFQNSTFKKLVHDTCTHVIIYLFRAICHITQTLPVKTKRHSQTGV